MSFSHGYNILIEKLIKIVSLLRGIQSNSNLTMVDTLGLLLNI